MTGPTGSDPLDDLRRANPVDVDSLPSATLSRVEARIREKHMNEGSGTTVIKRGRGFLRPAGLGLAGAIGALALVLAITVGGRAPGGAPSTSNPPSLGGPVTGSCVETYSLDTLARRTYAFDGTVKAINGDDVTFTVNRAFRGTSGSEVTLTATGMTGTAITSAGGPALAVGSRYLVAGDDTFVWACGFTQPYDEAVAGAWAGALGR